MSVEQWKPVHGYEGAYEVSSLGRVRSLDRKVVRSDGSVVNHVGIVLRQKYNNHYMRTGLSRNGVTESWCVHRLVADAFDKPKPTADSVVRHLNGDHLDNRASNLKWGTHAENGADMVAHGRSGASLTHCKRGHEFTQENTYRSPGSGSRNCRQCDQIRRPASLARRRERRIAERAPNMCRVCGAKFTAHASAAFCSDVCKKASRRVAFIRRGSSK